MIDDDAPAPSPEKLEGMAREAEAAALAVRGVSQAETAGASWFRRRLHLAASNGFSGGYSRAGASLFVSAIAGEGLEMERDYRAESRRSLAALPPSRWTLLVLRNAFVRCASCQTLKPFSEVGARTVQDGTVITQQSYCSDCRNGG